VVDFLEEKFSDHLQHETHRNQSLSPRHQIQIFLHFLGTNTFYHVLRDCHGVGTNTVMRHVHKIADLIFEMRQEFIHWPENCSNLARQFQDLGGFPCVCGTVDGTHIPVIPPKADEESFINRHHSHSLNAVMVSGPNLMIYYANCRAPGRWHDSHVSHTPLNEQTLAQIK
jgi:hypothetical protein